MIFICIFTESNKLKISVMDERFNYPMINAIKEKCQELLLKWEIIETDSETGMVIVLNSETKVSIRTEISQEDGIVYHVLYKIQDDSSIVYRKRANIVIRPDGDNYGEWSGFKDLQDVLNSLNK